MPISLHARMIRSAISPRLAISIFLNTQTPQWSPNFKLLGSNSKLIYLNLDVELWISRTGAELYRFDHEERLPVFHGLSILDKDLNDLTGCLGFNLVHEFHGLNNTEYLPFFHDVTAFDIGRLVR